MPTATTTRTYAEIARDILTAFRSENPRSNHVNYATNYLRVLTAMDDNHEAYVQSLYVLSNLATWRGEPARALKAELKAHPKL